MVFELNINAENTEGRRGKSCQALSSVASAYSVLETVNNRTML